MVSAKRKVRMVLESKPASLEAAKGRSVGERQVARYERLMAAENPVERARRMARMLGEPGIATRADLARELGVTRSRVTQVLDLLRLPEAALELADRAWERPEARARLTERALRPICRLGSPAEQREALEKLLGGAGVSDRKPGAPQTSLTASATGREVER